MFAGYTNKKVEMARFTKKRQGVFLKTLIETGNVSRAADDAGMSRAHCYKFKNVRDENGDFVNRKFSDAWDEAIEISVDYMVEEGRRRAMDGVEKPVGWFRGTPGGRVKEYSDNLLMFLIKAHRPMYRDKFEGKLTGEIVIIKQEPGYVGSQKTTVQKKGHKTGKK